MGQYFKIVNVTKKKFIDIDSLGENCKFGYVGQGLNGIALGRLLISGGDGWANEFYKVYGHPEKDEIYFGAWAGDQIVITGDYDNADTNGIKSSIPEIPDQNLYHKIEYHDEYEDITIKVIEWLANNEFTAELLADRAKRDEELLGTLSNLVYVKKHKLIEKSLIKVIGKDWTKKLKKK
ncbi:hypothetical protein [uncultured Aquimarina sp.]|uniref:hypothetical protein n=1 Tax=uncultured Aquimarina sp. TaxID=575652 RepID=UPI002618B1E1|nr:hypothetical protein [uncultured Aquimarina sp.]